MATKAQKTKVGLFLLICGAGMVAAIVAIAGYHKSAEQRYVIVFENSVLGLNKGGLVEYQGIQVGRVDELYVTNDGKARVEILIDSTRVQLHEGVEATLEFFSLATGTMCVVLKGGEQGNPLLKPGSTIPAVQSLVESVSSQAGDLIAAVKVILDKFSTSLDGLGSGELTQTVRDLHTFVQETQGFVTDARQTVSLVTDDVHGSMNQAKASMEKFNALAESTTKLVTSADAAVKLVQQKIEPLDLANTEKTMRDQLVQLSEQLKSTATEFGKTAQTVNYGTGNLEHSLLETMGKLNETLESLRDLALYLQQDPSAIVRGKGIKGEK